MSTNKCKICKRLANKAFLKGERCNSAKCPLTRAASTRRAPGAQKSKHKKSTSEFALQLREKQKIKFGYGMRERQFNNCVKKAMATKSGSVTQDLYEILESRLDNVVYRCGFGASRTITKQIVTHGHVLVNGRRVDIPSYEVNLKDKVQIRPQSMSKGVFKDLDSRLKKYSAPAWISLDKEKKIGEITGKPSLATDPETASNLVSIIEFYNR